MSAPVSSAYKESGFAWLGRVPVHWNITRLKYLGDAIIGLTYDPSQIVDVNSGTLVFRASNVQGGKIVLDDNVYVDATIPPELVTRVGDILICSRSGSRDLIGKNATIDELSSGQTFGAFMTIFRSEHSRYVSWLLNSPLFEFQSGAFLTSTINQLTVGVLKNIEAPLPPKAEREKIVAFLDHETDKIDALVAEQERLIALLKENRQAVISHAVTKGLDPKAPMKDAGVLWLGEIPRHWDGIQLGRICRRVSDGPHFSPAYVGPDEGIMFLSARNIQADKWSLNDAKFISHDDYSEFCKRVIPERGDILYTKGGTTGIARVVDLDMKFQVWVHVAVLKLHAQTADPYFVAFALNSVAGYEQSQLYTRGATNQDLGLTRMAQIWLALPPLKEQRAIVSFLSDRITNLDHLSFEATRAIALLSERRAALISAAVTGKINVRDAATVSEAA